MRRWIVIAAMLSAGCTPVPTVIVDLEEDKVVIQADAVTAFDEIKSMAAEGCALHHRKPIAISASCAGRSSCYTS